jgi:16S rRNA (cytidine1402-2'-O)-methyltransferase
VRTVGLLSHFGLQRPLKALHDHNEEAQVQAVLEQMQAGKQLALVSDAGTPLISDPGYKLVHAVREAGFHVVPIPGPCALIAALSASGLATDRFAFEGFLPNKSAARQTRMRALAGQSATLVFYESSHRIEEFLVDAVSCFGSTRCAVIARELSKKFETFYSADLAGLLARVQSDPDARRGEFVVMLEGAPEQVVDMTEAARILRILQTALPPSAAAKLTAQITGLSRQDIYQLVSHAESEQEKSTDE